MTRHRGSGRHRAAKAQTSPVGVRRAVLAASAGVLTMLALSGGTSPAVVQDAGADVRALETPQIVDAASLGREDRSAGETTRGGESRIAASAAAAGGAASSSAVEPAEVGDGLPRQRARTGVSAFAIMPGVKLALRPPTPEEQAAELRRKAEQLAGSAPIHSFVVSSFNILGSQHTKGRKGYAPGTARAASATRLLLSRGVSIVGFSEIQADQLGVFRRNAPSFGAYPGTAAGPRGVPQTLAWDTRVWRLEDAWTFNIPFSHQIRPQPVVKLASVATGAQIYVVNVHNSPQGMEAERDRAMAIEVGIINRLAASGLPVVMTGDFNEKAEALCRFTTSTPLVSAVGGSGCTPARGARVDWIFASRLSVESYNIDRSAPIPSITDHAVMFSRLSRS